jgi:GABA permease
VRNPFSTEAEAFSFVLVVLGLFAAVAVAGILGGGWVALGVFLALGLGIWAGMYLKGEPKVQEPAVWERRPPEPGRRRILVVANETVAGRALRDEVRRRTGQADDVLVVSPALNSHIRHWTSDEDEARAAAQRRLDESLAALSEDAISARGQVGDGDPLQAIEDALRTFDADEVIVSTHPPGRSNWLERDVIEHARERFPIPITHVVVDLEAERATASSAKG